LPDKRILQRGELISFLVAIIVINRREFIDPIYLTIRCAGTPSQSEEKPVGTVGTFIESDSRAQAFWTQDRKSRSCSRL